MDAQSHVVQPVVPRRQLTVWHAVSVCVGTVIGAGIFATPPLAAAQVSSPAMLMTAWALGGVLSLIGALCFAEMAAAFPDAGGDYYFLRRAYGDSVGFLFAWSRFAVIHTGSMAMLAFVFGDYLAQIIDLGPFGSALYGASIIVLLAAINLAGLRFGIGTQVTLMMIVLFGLACVGLAGLWLGLTGRPMPAAEAPELARNASFGVAMIYILLAYGGWSDAATLSSEMLDERRGIMRALIIGMTLVTVLYLAANLAFLRALGHAGLIRSTAPAADVMLVAFGKSGQLLMVGVVAITAITVMNALLIAGARTTYAAARDTDALARVLGRWHVERGTPPAAIVALSFVALLLVGFGAFTRHGVSTMVDYMSPVFWSFLAMSGLGVIVLRRRHPEVARPFVVPFYPWLPLIFVGSCLYVLWSSVIYVKLGAMVGVAVLAAGALALAVLHRWNAR